MRQRLLFRYWSSGLRVSRNDSGASAVEYALIVALIAIVITVGVTAFGSSLNTFFSGLWAELGL